MFLEQVVKLKADVSNTGIIQNNSLCSKQDPNKVTQQRSATRTGTGSNYRSN